MTQLSLQEGLNLAIQHHQAGRLSEAEMIYRQILAANPNHPDALHLLGMIAFQCAKPILAIDLIRRAIAINPSAADYHANLAHMLLTGGAVEDAIQSYLQAVNLNPADADIWNRLGIVLHQSIRMPEAIEAYRRALAIRPDFPDGLNNLGTALTETGKLDLGLAQLQRSIELRPNQPEAHNNLGNTLQNARRFDEAIESYQKAIAIRPEYPEAYNNLGSALRMKGRLDEAIANFRKAIELRPEYPDAINSMGVTLLETGNFSDAFASYRQALTMKPDLAEAHQNLAIAMLLHGDFENGWKEYEWRWKTKESLLSKHQFAKPRWAGENLNGRTILLHVEQGFGDAFHFIRYLPRVAESGGRIILACQKELLRLLRQFDQVHQFITQGDAIPPFDAQCPLLSLPLVFGTTLENIPAQVPYISATPNSTFELPASPDLKVGLCWAGRFTHKRDWSRSIPITMLSSLAKIPGVQFHSLQTGESASQYSQFPGLTDWSGKLTDFADTASLIQNLDLVVTVDTAVAHLVGAMGKPVWVLLSHVPDWRWMLQGENSPWYPTMRLFRQSAPEQWDEPISKVHQSLQSMTESRR